MSYRRFVPTRWQWPAAIWKLQTLGALMQQRKSNNAKVRVRLKFIPIKVPNYLCTPESMNPQGTRSLIKLKNQINVTKHDGNRHLQQ
jgi:hypothetical protein